MTVIFHGGHHPDDGGGGSGGSAYRIDSRNGGSAHGVGTEGDDTFFVKTDGQPANQIHIHAGGGNDTFRLDMGVVGSRSIQHGHHIFAEAGSDKFYFDNVANMRGTVVGRLDDFDGNSDEIWIANQKLDLHNPGAIAGLKVSIVGYLGQQWLQIVNQHGGRALYALEGARQVRSADGTWHDEEHFLAWNHSLPSVLPAVHYENPVNFLSSSMTAHYNPARVISAEGVHQSINISGGASNELIDARRGNDVIYGGAGQDYIRAHMGNDTVHGGEGNDLIEGGKGFDLILGGVGHDTIAGGSDADTINGGDGNDLIFGGSENDIILGGNGVDRLYGGPGNDTVRGGAGNDLIHGDSGNDLLAGGEGADMIFGGSGNDAIEGGAGWDKLLGGAGADTIHGNLGNDTIFAGGDNDLIYAGDGDDVVCGDSGNDSIFGGSGADVLGGQAGNDVIQGGLGADTMYGGLGNDMLSGSTGNDKLFGNAGRDTLHGGDGNDTISGGLGKDWLHGGADSDTFVFADVLVSAPGNDCDVIIDFNRSDGDRIDLRGIDANFAMSGNQAFAFIGDREFNHSAGQLRYESSGSNLVIHGDIDGDGQADFSIQMSGLSSLSAGDLML